MVFRRAIRETDKEARRAAILTAARQLLTERGNEKPATVSQVACAAGVAKGTLYLYFKSSEEIYLALLEEQYNDWFSSIESALAGDELPADPDRALDGVLTALAEYPVRQPLFLQLANLHHSMIDSVPGEALRAWKMRLFERLDTLGARLEERFDYPAGDGLRLLRNTHSLVLGLHQMATPSAKVRELLDKEEFSHQQIDFEQELNIALRALWHGWRHRPAATGNIRRTKQ